MKVEKKKEVENQVFRCQQSTCSCRRTKGLHSKKIFLHVFDVKEIHQSRGGERVQEPQVLGFSPGPLSSTFQSEQKTYSWPCSKPLIYQRQKSNAHSVPTSNTHNTQNTQNTKHNTQNTNRLLFLSLELFT